MGSQPWLDAWLDSGVTRLLPPVNGWVSALPLYEFRLSTLPRAQNFGTQLFPTFMREFALETRDHRVQAVKATAPGLDPGVEVDNTQPYYD